MRKKPTRKRPYFTMETALTAILRDASVKMHHGILFDRRLENGKKKKKHCRVTRQALPCYTAVARLGFKRRATAVPNSIHKL